MDLKGTGVCFDYEDDDEDEDDYDWGAVPDPNGMA
jgi:hypothetical protein